MLEYTIYTARAIQENKKNESSVRSSGAGHPHLVVGVVSTERMLNQWMSHKRRKLESKCVSNC